MRGKNSGIVYDGWFEFGDVIRQELKGPKGEGSVIYPNGDHFEGFFHLNYAHIYGPAYAADGKYTFADGSVIEHAWINTSDDLEVMDLIGIYPVKRAIGPDTITPFYRHKINGIEIVLSEKRYAIEWFDGERIQDLELASYDYKQLDENRSVLTITLKNGIIIEQRSGDTELNSYDHRVFKTHLGSDVYYPDGSSIDFWGYPLKQLKPFHGYMTVHTTDGKCHEEKWDQGELVKLENEKWDVRGAKVLQLPDPFNKNDIVECRVWNGHIDYFYRRWIYDGDMADDRPNGIGVLVGDSVDTRGRRYEGEFKDGLCHGHGVFTYPEGGITQDGDWMEGVFQEDEAPDAPIMLNVWLHGDDTEKTKVEAKVGKFPYFTGFGGLRIDRIEKRCITFAFYSEIKLLTPGETIHFYNEIDGREDHDGCVYESYEYYLDITWKP